MLIYEEIVGKLFDTFPQYKNSEIVEKYDREIPTLVFSGFAAYLRGKVDRLEDKELSNEIRQITRFLNDMADSEDVRVVDLLNTGFFEAILGEKDNLSEKVVELLNSELNIRAKKNLHNVANWKRPISLNRFLLE